MEITKMARTEKKVEGQEYNAVGSRAMAAAHDEKPGFKKGGAAHETEAEEEREEEKEKKKKMRRGGKVEGKEARERADRKPRGEKRHKRAAGGRTPYSTGSKEESGMDDRKGAGHESERPPMGGV
jgi:hypothetical protein